MYICKVQSGDWAGSDVVWRFYWFFLSHAEVHMTAKSPEAPLPLILLLLRLLPDPNID